MTTPRQRPVVVHAHAKLNLTLRVLGTRTDGYHELRTTFQSLALHDTLSVIPAPGPFEVLCDDPACPGDPSNLVWQAAERLWRHLRRSGAVRGVRIRIAKRIPMQAGLGGGSSDAAAALTALAVMWGGRASRSELRAISRDLGADVPYFFDGGTALGLERGDFVVPLPDCRPSWALLVLPGFGVSTVDVYRWWDEVAGGPPRRRNRQPIHGLRLPATEFVNDLEGPVVEHHPEVGRIVARLGRLGAAYTAMSGSGLTVFGLFHGRLEAVQAAASLNRPPLRVLVTRTIGRDCYGRLSAPRA